jgi:hypothetical protein
MIIECIRTTDTSMRTPMSATAEEFSEREFLQLESRLYQMIGQWRRKEPDDAEYSKILLYRKRQLTARYAEVLRDKLDLWEITEQLEASERFLTCRV